MRLFTITIFTLIIPVYAQAIQFDMWETGMTLNDMVATAREHNLPLVRSGIIMATKNFNPKVLDESFYKANLFEYKGLVAGKNSQVLLKVTDDADKYLYQMEIKLFGAQNDMKFGEDLLAMLSKKYGKPKKRNKILFNVFTWRPDKVSEVSLSLGSSPIITYTDLEILEYQQKLKAGKSKDSLEADQSKF